jgi:hypothetical protein
MSFSYICFAIKLKTNKMNFTKRDFKMIALGFFTFFIVDGVYHWRNCVKGFKEGWNSFPSTNTK